MKNIYEAIAKEYADHELDTIYYTVKAAVLYGLQKGCEIEREKAENIGRTDEELVKKIESVMYSHAAPLPASGLQIIYIDSVNKIATEIAKLLPSSRCQENDAQIWYTESEMYDWLVLHDYSKEIAKELSAVWAKDLQGAFEKGWEKAKRENCVSILTDFAQYILGRYSCVETADCFTRLSNRDGIRLVINSSPKEIADRFINARELLQSKIRQENDVNVELLEAAKYFHEAWLCEYSKITALRSDVDKHSNAITNAEKQTKL